MQKRFRECLLPRGPQAGTVMRWSTAETLEGTIAERRNRRNDDDGHNGICKAFISQAIKERSPTLSIDPVAIVAATAAAAAPAAATDGPIREVK